MIIERINQFVENMGENKAPKAELRLSAAGDCQRKLEYDFQVGIPPITAQHFFRMQLGHAFHKDFQEILTLCFGDDYYGAEEEVVLGVYPGHPDGIIKSLDCIVEVKSVSDSTFTMVQNQSKPLDAHIDQSNAYAIAAKVGNVLVIYINRDTGVMSEFMFPASQYLADAVVKKFQAVTWNTAKGEISPRPYHDATESPCWFCSHVERCYAGFESEVAAFEVKSIAWSDDPGLVDRARQAVRCREARLVSEKMEKTLKDMISGQLHNSNVKLARLVENSGQVIEAEIKVGKNANLLLSLKEKNK